VTLLLGACSVNQYNAPIGSFAAATKDAQTALASLDDQVTDAYEATLRANALQGKSFVSAVPGDCEVRSQRCRAELRNSDGTRYPFPPESALLNMERVMDQISTYAKNLDALVNADTAAQVKSSVDAALGSAQNIAATVAKAAGAPGGSGNVPQFATPVGSAVTWAVGQYIVRVKLNGLRTATSAAQKPIADAATLFQTAADFASDPQRRALANAVTEKIDAFRSSNSPQNFDAYIAAITTYDKFLVAKPSGVFLTLREAHDALANHLNNEEVSLGTVLAKMQSFAAEAKQLSDIVKALAALANEKK
jgi:hypothetical protein